MFKTFSFKFTAVALISVAVLLSCQSLPFFSKQAGTPGEVKDEARLAKRTVASFPAADEDYFPDMDGGASSRRTKSKAATPGSSGPAATTASGTSFRDSASARSIF